MRKTLSNFLFSGGLFILFFSIHSLFPSNVLAGCCGNNGCSGNQQCVNIPANCGLPGFGQGVCVNNYETCSGTGQSSSCTGGECCVNQLCRNCTGGGGGGCPCGSYQLSGCSKGCGSSNSGICGYTTKHEPKYSCSGYACNSCPTCNTTSPSGLSVIQATSTSATISWTPGANGTTQQIFIGDTQVAVEANCVNGVGAGTGCVADPVVPSIQNIYTTDPILTPGNIYYYRIQNFKDANCSSNSATSVAISSCDISPTSATVQEGATADITSTVQQDSTISSVTFTGNNTYISENPGSTNTYPYGTVVTGVKSTGNSSTPLTSSVYVTGNASPICTATAAITVTPKGPWWQVIDSDVTTMGDISSKIPGGEFFDLKGSGNYPGVPVYGGTTTLATSSVSQAGWTANSSNASTRIFDSTYFQNFRVL